MPTSKDIRSLSTKFTDVEDETIDNWLEMAQNTIDPRIPANKQDYAIKLLAASIGWTLMYQEEGGVQSDKVNQLETHYYDLSAVDDPFARLYQDLLDQLGIGKNRVLFY